MFHLLQEEEITKALENFAEPEQVWERNIKVMNDKGSPSMQELVSRCKYCTPEDLENYDEPSV